MTDKEKVRQLLVCDICKDKVKCDNQLQKHNTYKCNVYYLIEGAMKWKEQQIKKKFVKRRVLENWYQDSINEEIEPIWTDKHLDELFNDFYLLPKRKDF